MDLKLRIKDNIPSNVNIEIYKDQSNDIDSDLEASILVNFLKDKCSPSLYNSIKRQL